MDLLSKKEINGEELKELLHLRNNNKLQFLLVDVREEYMNIMLAELMAWIFNTII